MSWSDALLLLALMAAHFWASCMLLSRMLRSIFGLMPFGAAIFVLLFNGTVAAFVGLAPAIKALTRDAAPVVFLVALAFSSVLLAALVLRLAWSLCGRPTRETWRLPGSKPP